RSHLVIDCHPPLSLALDGAADRPPGRRRAGGPQCAWMAAREASEVSILISRLGEGEAEARDELLPLVYDELEAIARAYTRGTATSLDARGLVHELYLRLVATP